MTSCCSMTCVVSDAGCTTFTLFFKTWREYIGRSIFLGVRVREIVVDINCLFGRAAWAPGVGQETGVLEQDASDSRRLSSTSRFSFSSSFFLDLILIMVGRAIVLNKYLVNLV